MTKLEKEALLKPEQIEKLKELFPQAVVDGKVDFVLLKALLGEQIEVSNEKYQFTWNGKQNAIAHAQKPSSGTLREDKSSSKDFDSTENLYIEGDNLEVLKLLQKTYQGKIKMIYIDPPYNTGNDFVYKDDFKDNVKNYLELTNQKNKSNAETSGRYHTDWLNMMYPRLMLARNLLTDDGVIFISIDDNEQANLKKMCDEIFGEGNFIANFSRQTRFGGGFGTSDVGVENDYVLVFSKDRTKGLLGRIAKEKSEIESYFNKKDEFGPYHLRDLKQSIGQGGKREDRPFMFFPFYLENNIIKLISYEEFKLIYKDNKFDDKFIDTLNKKYKKLVWPLHGEIYGRWTCGYESALDLIKNNDITIISNSIYKKERITEDRIGKVITTLLTENTYTNSNASQEVKNLLNGAFFDFPKPVELIKLFLLINVGNSFTTLDFFSGSGTTAHAVMKLNAEDGGNRNFIMVQLPEKTEEDSEAYKAGYQNICEIGKERIRRAGEKVRQEMLEKDASADVSNLDVGFKVFKLDSTNIKPWDGTQDINQMLLEASGNVVKPDRTDLDVVHELMLMYGVFNEEIEEIKMNDKTLYSIGNHFLVVCLFNTITKQDIEAIIKLKPKNVIFNDAGFENDNVKINAELTLKNHGVEDIKSL